MTRTLVEEIKENIADLDMSDWRQLKELETKLYELLHLNKQFRLLYPTDNRIPETRIHDNLIKGFINIINETIFEIRESNISSTDDSSSE